MAKTLVNPTGLFFSRGGQLWGGGGGRGVSTRNDCQIYSSPQQQSGWQTFFKRPSKDFMESIFFEQSIPNRFVFNPLRQHQKERSWFPMENPNKYSFSRCPGDNTESVSLVTRQTAPWAKFHSKLRIFRFTSFSLLVRFGVEFQKRNERHANRKDQELISDRFLALGD